MAIIELVKMKEEKAVIISGLSLSGRSPDSHKGRVTSYGTIADIILGLGNVGLEWWDADGMKCRRITNADVPSTQSGKSRVRPEH